MENGTENTYPHARAVGVLVLVVDIYFRLANLAPGEAHFPPALDLLFPLCDSKFLGSLGHGSIHAWRTL